MNGAASCIRAPRLVFRLLLDAKAERSIGCGWSHTAIHPRSLTQGCRELCPTKIILVLAPGLLGYSFAFVILLIMHFAVVPVTQAWQ